jgi:hypothetical protein
MGVEHLPALPSSSTYLSCSCLSTEQIRPYEIHADAEQSDWPASHLKFLPLRFCFDVPRSLFASLLPPLVAVFLLLLAHHACSSRLVDEVVVVEHGQIATGKYGIST